MAKQKIGVIIPTNRPDRYKDWLAAWEPLFDGDEYTVSLYAIFDEPETWQTIRQELGSDAWIISTRSDAIRSYGYLLAYRAGMDVLMTFDDDVMPWSQWCIRLEPTACRADKNPIAEHLKWLTTMVEPESWVRTLQDLPTRGLPLTRPIVLNHGLWTGVPDVTAERQLAGIPDEWGPWASDSQIIPRGKFFPMSGMNLAWRRELTPWMYFGLTGYDIRDPERRWGLDRVADILCGVMMKPVADWRGWAVRSGTPYVHHQRASDPVKNLELEREALATSGFWAQVAGNPKRQHRRSKERERDLVRRIASCNMPSPAYCQAYVDALGTWQRLLTQ